MQSESSPIHLEPGQLYDQTTNSTFKVVQNHIVVENVKNHQIQRYPLPPLISMDEKPNYSSVLKFISKSSNVNINATGNVLVCKSPIVQQIDMNKSFSNKDRIFWQLYVPQKTLHLTVGIKSLEHKKTHAFEFSLNKPTTLTFKLDLANKSLTCWINQNLSQSHKPISIEIQSNWTPFIRIKGTGSSVILNTIVANPDQSVESYLEDSSQCEFSAFKNTEIKNQNLSFAKNPQSFKLLKASNQKILLIGSNHIKVISRQNNSENFDFKFVQFSQQQSKLYIPFTKSQHQYLRSLQQRLNISGFEQNFLINQNQQYFLSISKQQWRLKSLGFLNFLSKIQQKHVNCFENQKIQNLQKLSLGQLNYIAKIVLSKIDIVNPHLLPNERLNTLYSQYYSVFCNNVSLPFFQPFKTDFQVPKQLFLNSLPFLRFQGNIANVKSTNESYVGCLIAQGNRICVVNIQGIPFKVIDTVISRGFAKHSEINQYKKQIEEIKDVDFSKPHIFKILKNCLKYADKIKPPEKILNQIQKKKEQIEQKKAVKEQKQKPLGPVADKSLLNTLIMMGFGQKASTKALIQCKNQSLEAAIQLILSKYKDQPVEKQTPNKNKPKNDWQCEVCTLINSRQVSICSACDSPAPITSTFNQLQIIEQKKQELKIQQPKQVKQQEINSSTIENQVIKNFYIWETKVVFCPVLIAAVFQNKIRFRLVGPNPKFYSHFYSRDNGFIDLTTLKIHEYAHQIDQTQINHMFYSNSTSQQLKKNSWGWMNIQDWDLNNIKNVQNIDFVSVKSTNKDHLFKIRLNSQKIFNARIIFDNVYEQKKRCFIVQQAKQVEDLGLNAETQNHLNKKSKFIIRDQLTVSKNHQVYTQFSSQSTKKYASQIPQQDNQYLKNLLVPSKSAKNNHLQLIALAGPYHAQLKYPNTFLESININNFNKSQLYRNGIVFVQNQGKSFTLSSLKIGSKNKTTASKRGGFAYLVNDLSKKPLIEHKFQFLENSSQVQVDFTQQKGKYLVVVLNPHQNNESLFEINHINAYGQILPTQQLNVLSKQFIEENLKIQFQDFNVQRESFFNTFRVQMSCSQQLPYDLSVLSEQKYEQYEQLVKRWISLGVSINIRMILSLKQKEKQNLKIKSISLTNFKVVQSYTLYDQQQPEVTSLDQYKTALQSYLLTGQTQFLQTISKQSNKQYRKIVSQINLQDFLSNKLICCPYDKRQKNNYKLFISTFGQYIKGNSSMNGDNLFRNLISKEKLTTYGLQLLFELAKFLSIPSKNCISLLQTELKSISKMKNNLEIQGSKFTSQISIKQKCLFSDLLNNLLLIKDKNFIKKQQNQTHYHYICQKGSTSRKYIIDLISLYSVDKLKLKIQQTKQKAKLNLEVSYIAEQSGLEQSIIKKFYEQHVWNQLCSKNSNYIQLDLNQLKTRYLIVRVSFVAVPYNQHKKDQDYCPSNQIIPLVYGTYAGESAGDYLKDKFEVSIQKLHLVKKIGHFTKYSLNERENTYYYNSQQLFEGEHKYKLNELEELLKKQDSPANRQLYASYLIQNNFSRQNLNYHFTLSYLIINYLNQALSTNEIKDIQLSQDFINHFIEHLINKEKGPLSQKAIQLIKKIISTSSEVFENSLKSKIASESSFNAIFKQIKIVQDQNYLSSIQKLIGKQVAQSQKNKSIILNLSWLMKLYNFDIKIVQKLVQKAFDTESLDQVSTVFYKYGWTSYTQKILNSLIQSNKKDKLVNIVNSSKNNKQLCSFAFNQLKKERKQIFEIVMNQIQRKQRNIKISDLSQIVLYSLTNIIPNLEQEFQKREEYLNVISLLNKYGHTSDITDKIYDVFFCLEEKNACINQLLSSTFLREKKEQQKFLKVLLQKLNNSSLKSGQLNLLSEILVYLFNKQIIIQNQNANISLDKNTQSVALKFFSNFLKKYLNIGGLQSAKLVDESINTRIKIGYYLSYLLQDKKVFTQLSSQNISDLIHWLIININTGQNNLKTPNCARFIKIQQAVWRILQVNGKEKQEVFVKNFMKIYQQLKSKFEGINNSNVRYNSFKKLYVLNIKIVEIFSKQSKFLKSLLYENSLFVQVLNQFSSLDKNRISQSVQNKQEQLVNQLKLFPSNKDQPKDWLIYKNGAKNHVYKVQYLNGSQETVSLTFQNEQQYTLSKVIFGFKLDTSTEKNVCLPKQIKVEGGSSLEKMRFLGEMSQIKDDRYFNYSVKLFGFNTNILKGTQSVQSISNKTSPIKYLRFKIVSPQNVSIQDALITQKYEQKNSVSMINFLSVQGYRQKTASPHTAELVRFLEIITKPQHKELINNLFTSKQVNSSFKIALLNISYLMKNQKYQKILHNFLMRICQQNTIIGNEMIQKYLQLQNSELCSKISAEIVLSNDKQLPLRAQLFYSFINKTLLQQKVVSDNILSFMNRFTQICFYAKTRKLYNQSTQIQAINLTVKAQLIQILLKFVESNSQSQDSVRIIQKYIKNLLTLSTPFIVQGFALKDILSILAERKNKVYDQILSALVVDNTQARSWFMENKLFEKTFDQTFELIKTTDETTKINKNLEFLTLLSYNSNIKQLINKYQYNLRLFQMLMSKNYESVLSKADNLQLRRNFVDFIARTSLGSENQTIIAALLKDSIPNIISQGNQKFVGQIFLPLLNSYQKIPVCVLPYSQAQNKLITDISNQNITQNSETKSPRENQQSTTQGSFRLPSTLASPQIKQRLFQQLKKLQYSSGNFNLAINHGTYAVGLGQSVQNKIINGTNSFLIIFKTKSNDSEPITHTVSIFYNRKNNKSSQNNRKLLWQDGTFIMVSQNTQNKITLIDKPEGDKTLFSYHSMTYDDEEDQSVQSQSQLLCNFNSRIFGQLSFSYDNSHFFDFSVLSKQINSTHSYLQTAQYWVLSDSSKSSTTDRSVAAQNSSLSNLTKSLFSSNYNHDLFSRQHLGNNCINALRYQNVYEFPSSITVSQLKQTLRIMNCSISQNKINQVKLNIFGSQDALKQETTLEDIKKKNTNKQGIPLDFRMNFDNILQVLNLKDQTKKEEVDFLPRKGILKYFQENDGIQAMIKVIKKSIESWKNKNRMEKWLQYVIELQNFSHFPHFFAIYLKDKQTFKLLFNLLAGLPDKQTDPKWDELQSTSSQKLLKIVSQILHMDKTSDFRQYALKNNFFTTILERLRILTGQFKRKYEKDLKQQQQDLSPSKNNVEDDGTKKIKKKKGVGYGNDSSSNTKWMKGQGLQEKKKQFEIVKIILNIIENFLDIRNWKMSENLLENIFESALLPFIEDGLRAGTLLEISKHPQKFKAIFKIIKVFAKHQRLVPILLPLKNNYQPRQIQSIQSLLKSLQNTANIFLSCLNQNKSNQTKQEQASEQLAKLIKQTYLVVEESIEQYKSNHMNDQNDQKAMQEILQLTLDKKYRALLKDLRFDYIDMKESPTKIKHHYSSSFTANYTPNQTKMIRLAQQLADISTALPYEHTNAVYVRCDKDRVDFMQALIMGSNGTPYGHGAFLFDIYFDDNYPNGPPKVNLTTTGHGKVRFNPNLYACGKVCLSLLGTWRGSASQNWDPKVSTLLQVLLSIQAIIMSQQVYFNQPGFQNQQGTQEGQKKNEAYSNIVRYCNIKFAMIDNMKNPPKGFETIIRRHFYLKKDEIMQQVKKWLKYAQKRPANYVGLVNDHNHSWSTQFKKTKTTYQQMLAQAIKQLQEQFNKLPVPKISDISNVKAGKKTAKKKQIGNKLEELQKQQNDQLIDVSYDKNKITQGKEIDISDEKVKDRWSRYIGAMGIDAVSKQSKADILIFGLNPLGLEVVKNLVLSGCRKLTICDDRIVEREDLSGGFFYTQEDINKKRTQSILYKIRQLNVYVKIDTIQFKNVTPDVLKTYSLVLATQIRLSGQLKIADVCRQNKVKFISADSFGFTCRIVNDLGQKFQVLDKNGEQPVEVFVKQITSAQKGVVTLLDGVKNPFEDGQAVLIRNVQGMKLKDQQSKSINDTIHKVKVINSKSFEIGNTLAYTPYIRNGTIKNIKTPVQLSYQPFQKVVSDIKNVYVDQNLAFFDFAKLQTSKLVKSCFLALDQFKEKNQNNLPESWNVNDMNKFIQIFKQIYSENLEQKVLLFVRKFVLTCRGYLPPLCAFFGGLVCQQIIKAITQKFKPIQSQFYLQFSEIVPQITQLTQENFNKIYSKKQTRDTGFEIVVGEQLLNQIKESKLFMIGSGAIGCQLLKNFAMIGFGTGQKGKITITDPDHIQNSNLNRQFLFRQKHISKSKSRTASQAVKIMNSNLKNHIVALTERVSDSTKDIFTNKFFQGLTLVANALDNVAARRYVDQRCVQNKVPLFESGTLGPKGHVQVIIPYLTESYGSQNDPVEQGQIPHCTLKMFPQQTLHCVEWARDIFGKKFSLQPKALLKIIDSTYKPEKDDIKALNDSLTMVKKGPKTFQDCINYAITKFYKYFRDDVMQLLYTYPLDAKTKNGEPFWKLPKRPPTPIKEFDPQNTLQNTFVSSLAVMIAKIYQIQYPKNFRSEMERLNIGKIASKIKIPEFVPSDQKAKEILKQSTQKKQQNAEQQKIEQTIQQKDEKQLYKQIMSNGGNNFKMKAEQFQKDDDANGHIDFIYSMANLRAINYKLDPMQWINVKIKAGRIVPALATTTACVSGLQTLQICKYIKKIKIDLMRNSYLNLAVPSIQMSEPGQVIKKKITQKLTVNLWDRWQVKCTKESTFGGLYEQLKNKYEINPVGVLQGMSRIDTGKSQQAKKAFLAQKILDKLQMEDKYIDIIVLFTKDEKEQKIMQGIPPVRLMFE